MLTGVRRGFRLFYRACLGWDVTDLRRMTLMGDHDKERKWKDLVSRGTLAGRLWGSACVFLVPVWEGDARLGGDWMGWGERFGRRELACLSCSLASDSLGRTDGFMQRCAPDLAAEGTPWR